MAAVYPGDVKQFVSRTDYVDTILAAHVNDLQDETHAVEATLGVSPHLPLWPSPVTSDTPATDPTVAGRFMRVEGGYDVPVCRVERRTDAKQTINNNSTTDIVYNAQYFDTHNMWASGTDVILARSGWWIITCDILWDFNASGDVRLVRMLVGGGEVSGNSIKPVADRPTRVGCSFQGGIKTGTHVKLRVVQDSGRNLQCSATLSLSHIRDLPSLDAV